MTDNQTPQPEQTDESVSEPTTTEAPAQGGSGVLGAMLAYVLGEEFAELLKDNREFGVQSVDDTIELQDALVRVHELEQELERKDEQLQTLQVVLGTVFLDIAAARMALIEGGDPDEFLDAAVSAILSARAGKPHFHIHE